MAKIPRITSRQFGSLAGANQIGEFGSFAAGNPTYTTDPALAQSRANWLNGWFSAVLGDNSPAIEDMNAFCFAISNMLSYVMQAGIPEWDAGTTYYKGSLALDPSGTGVVYFSLTDTNFNNLLTDMTKWQIHSGVFPNSIVTATVDTSIVSGTSFVRSNSTTGNLLHTLPVISQTGIGQRIVIKDVGTGGFYTSVKGNGAETIDGTNTYSGLLLQYDSITLVNNGLSWDVI